MTVDATLELGIVLRIAQNNKPAVREPDNSPRGTAKGGEPPTVSVSATPLESGKVKITVDYYQEDTGRLKSVLYSAESREAWLSEVRPPTEEGAA